MDRNRIDELFKESADQFHPVPSEASWEAVARNMKRSPRTSWKKWVGVAASLAVVLWVSTMLIRPGFQTMQGTGQIASITAPEAMPANNFLLPAREDLPAINLIKTEEQVGYSESIQFAVETNILQDQRTILPVMQVTSKRLVSLGGTPFELPGTIRKSRTAAVNIRYIANATDPGNGASKGKLGKLVEFAQQNSPAEMLANIREAKDNFISTKFNLN